MAVSRFVGLDSASFVQKGGIALVVALSFGSSCKFESAPGKGLGCRQGFKT